MNIIFNMEILDLIQSKKAKEKEIKDEIDEKYLSIISNLRFQLALFDIQNYLHSNFTINYK